MSESTALLARLSVLRVLLAQNYPEHHKTVLDAERALASAPQASQPPQGASSLSDRDLIDRFDI